MRIMATCESEKKDKQDANRKNRRKVKQQVGTEMETLSLPREISNVWDFGKDGKVYDRDMDEKDKRK